MYLNSITSKAKTYYNKLVTGVNYEYLPFFRITVGVIAIADILTTGSDFQLFFSNKATIVPQELSYLFTEYFNYLTPFYTFLRETGNLENFYDSVIAIYFITLICLIFGFCTRISAFLALLLQLIIFKSFALFNFGYDHFLTMSLFYCCIFPIGKFFSLDNKILKRVDGVKEKFNYQNMLRIHTAIVYLFAGLAKAIAITWWNGEAVWRSVSSIYDDLFRIPAILLTVGGILTIAVEVLYPILIYFKKTRKIMLIAVLLMHLSIAFMLQLPLFAGIMMIWNITAYYDDIKSLFKK